MRKICFGKNISTKDNQMTNLTSRDTVRQDLRSVYRMPENLKNISNCFKGCVNFTNLEATIPDTVENMSSSFEGCVNFTKNISIPNSCINLKNSFSNTGIKGTMYIPENVMDMSDSFSSSNIESVGFKKRDNNYINSIQNAFYNCKKMSKVEGLLPSTIDNATKAFKGTMINNINFIDENSFINIGDEMFSNCVQLNDVISNLHINSARNIFNGCSSLFYVSNIKGNDFSEAWKGCLNLSKIGVISGDLIFNNSFSGIKNYSNVVYLNPNSLNIKGTIDLDFLKNNPLKIFGVGHGDYYEQKFINGHLEDGAYMSGYCDIKDFIFDETNKCLISYNGSSDTIFIPKYFRTNILDNNTKFIPVFKDSFIEKELRQVRIMGGDISENAFKDAVVESVVIEYPYYCDGNEKDTAIINKKSFYNAKINNLETIGDTSKLNIGEYAFENAIISFANFYSFKETQEILDPSGGYFLTYSNTYFPSINNIKEYAFLNASGNLMFLYDVNTISNGAFKNFKGNIFHNNPDEHPSISNIQDESFKNFDGNFGYFKIINIGNNAFYNAQNINRLSLSYVKKIGENAFYNTNINSINIDDTTNILVANSLAGMNNLKDLTVDYLNVNHFGGRFSTTLTNVTMTGLNQDVNSTQKLTSVINIKMNGHVADNQFMNLKNLKYFSTYGGFYENVVNSKTGIIEKVYTYPKIGDNAFSNCVNLVDVYGTSLGDIKNNAFNMCSNLIYIGNVQNVFANAFNGCENLRKVNAYNIAIRALKGCYNISDLILRGQNIWSWNNNWGHIGHLWNFYNFNNATELPSLEKNEFFGCYSFFSSKYSGCVVNMSNKLENVNISLPCNYKYSSKYIFSNIKSLINANLTFSCPEGDQCRNPVFGCDNLKNYNITIGPIGQLLTSFPDASVFNGISNVGNININIQGFTCKYYSGSELNDLIDILTKCQNLKNVNFGTFGFINGRDTVVFDTVNLGNYSKNITILPDIYMARNATSAINWRHSNFTKNTIIPTNNIGVKSHLSSGNYYDIPSYGMDLTGKTIYFDNQISLNEEFFINRSNVNIYVEDISNNQLYFNGASNINIYYSNLNMKPNIYTNATVSNVSNQLILNNNDGKNYYYSKNINVIYEPNYNFTSYVSNIK